MHDDDFRLKRLSRTPDNILTLSQLSLLSLLPCAKICSWSLSTPHHFCSYLQQLFLRNGNVQSWNFRNEATGWVSSYTQLVSFFCHLSNGRINRLVDLLTIGITNLSTSSEWISMVFVCETAEHLDSTKKSKGYKFELLYSWLIIHRHSLIVCCDVLVHSWNNNIDQY